MWAQGVSSPVSDVSLSVDERATIPLSPIAHDIADVDVDGRIEEGVWNQIAPINEMRVIDPDTLTEVPYDTLTRVFYTERGIYVSFEMEQPV